MRTVTAALTVTVLAAVAGCDSHHAAAPVLAQLGHGQQIYDHSCAACHTLTGQGHNSSGGDLTNTKLSVADIASFARIMPLTRPLTPTEITAVARYIHTAARHRD